MSTRLPNNLLTKLIRATIEVVFIVFLFYANLVMGEFTHSNSNPGKTLFSAIHDVFTATNFIIGCITAIIGYFVFELLRRKFR